MKKIKRLWALALLFGIIFSQPLSVYAATEEFPSGIAYDGLGIEIENFVRKHEDTTVGMDVSVFHRDETVYKNYFGYADKESGIAVDEDTVMEWGSATKLLVWVSVMQLWEQGQIDLDKDVREYLPEGFLTHLKYDAPITMINLMNHNAGFQEVLTDIFINEQNAICSLEEALKAHEAWQIYEPGTVTAYSNWGVGLAAYVVEQISGESFDDYVHYHIFEPLHMEHSALSADLSDNIWVQEKRKELQCYTADGMLIPDCFYYIPLYPVGMCTSTLSDFESFGKALLNENSPLFQKPGTWKTLFTPTAYLGGSDAASNYHGLWVLAYGVETIGHGGNTAGCSSYLLLDPQSETGVVVMTNQANESVYNSEMMELIFGEFSEQHYFNTERRDPAGIYRPARTVRTGPFKIISLSFTDGETENDEFWMAETNGRTEKICYPYADYVRVPFWQFALEIALFILWAAALLFSIISLLVKLIRKIINVCRKKRVVIPLGIWSTMAAVIQAASIVLLAAMAAMAMSYALSSSYAWITIVFGMIAIVITGLIIYGIIMLRKTNSTKKRKLYNWTAVILLIITLANILYWNLFMWWKL